ncbi:uridine kinase [Blastococcus aggregatus]|uniref:Uridine kinase n=1 Tax=Blastococcus aggregatus TaxID=38502 RepID=A0A285V8I0_9ACTN|nr:uridine kinase [Blastococcus aggregatus]SOC50380.1 uridine kinase [Blastococcus aggregatus]
MDGDFPAIVDGVLAAAPADRRALVAIDGVGGSGKTTFAAELARRITTRPVLVLHVDDFFNPAEVRHARGRHSAEGFWLDSYNYSALRSWALEPLSSGDGRYRSSSFDRRTGRTVEPEARLAPLDALVVVEGTFLHRNELVSFWDHSIYLDVPFEETERRMAERDGLSGDAVHELMRRYTGAQRLYFASARPWERASVVVDNHELGRPRTISPASASAAH